MGLTNGVLPSNTLDLSSVVSKNCLFDSNLVFKHVFFFNTLKNQSHAADDQINIIPQGLKY